MKLIHEIGLELRSSAMCTGLRRLRYGHFTLTHALLTKHCDARSIAENIEFCLPVVAEAGHTGRSDHVIDRLREVQSDALEQSKIDQHISCVDDDDDDEYWTRQDMTH